ncbi:MAG: WD40 repeat domain-containing protein [Candidatus Babeliales bacterium]
MLHSLFRRNLLVMLSVIYPAPVVGMQSEHTSQKEDSPVIQTTKKQTQSLYNYFGLSNVCASQGLNDLKKKWVQEVMKGKEWWYSKEIDCQTDAPAQVVCYSSDGALLAAACTDNALRLYDQRGKKTVTKQYGCTLTGLVASPTQPFMIASLDNQTLERVDYTGKTVKIVKDQSGPRVLAINQQGTHICTWPHKGEAGVIPRMKIWPLEGGIPTHHSDVKSSQVAFCQKGTDFLAVADNKLELHEYEGDRGIITYATDPNVKKITAVAAHPYESVYATGGDNGTVTIWHKDQTLKKQSVLRCHYLNAVSILLFNQRGSRLFVANHSNVFVFDMHTNKEVARLEHLAIVRSIAIKPCKNQLVVACDDHATKVWEKYNEPRFELMLLRLVLKEHLTLCILKRKKPMCPSEKQQATDDAFICWMAKAFNLNLEQLLQVWRENTDANLRKSVIRTYVDRVKSIHTLQEKNAIEDARKKKEEQAAREREWQEKYERSKAQEKPWITWY